MLFGGIRKKIKEFKEELKDLKLTIETMKKESMEIFNRVCNSTAHQIDDPLWFMKHNHSIHYSEQEELILKQAKINYVNSHPSLKEKLIFHAGCLLCVMPEKEGIGVCGGCKYLLWHSGKDLSKTEVEYNESC